MFCRSGFLDCFNNMKLSLNKYWTKTWWMHVYLIQGSRWMAKLLQLHKYLLISPAVLAYTLQLKYLLFQVLGVQILIIIWREILGKKDGVILW